jgi:hypothetical protein
MEPWIVGVKKTLKLWKITEIWKKMNGTLDCRGQKNIETLEK